jgi:hypothetical protein
MKRNEMREACSDYGGREAGTGFWWGKLRERNHWGDPGLDGRTIILRWIFRKWDVQLWNGSSYLRIWVGRALVNMVMNRRVPKNAGNFLSS